MKLISMTDFVLENTSKKLEDYSNKELLLKIRNYAKFLKQPLKLEMFQYETKLFSNAEIIEDEGETWIFHNNKYRFRTLSIADMTIEDLSWSNLELTPNAIKQLGL